MSGSVAPLYEALAKRWGCKPIHGCPGRSVLSRCPPGITPREIVGEEVPVLAFHVPAARDTVLVAPFEGGGLISYSRRDGTFIHTLNTESGFRRKLEALGISLQAR